MTLAVVLTLGVGCAGADVATYEAQRVAVEVPDALRVATVGAGDVFEVRVYGEKELSGLYRVSPEGSIEFPLVGRVDISGQTPREVSETLRSRLMDGFIRDPHVSVFVKEYNSKKVFVIGQVQRPGTFPFEERMNIVQAITQAGGFTPTAARDRTLVTRTIDGREVQIPVPVDRIATGEAVNFPLAPGDIVFVPEGIL